MINSPITIIGGGLAGCEAAWQAANHGAQVTLYDMKPDVFSPAHESVDLGELVCSNSFRSNDPASAVGLLKEEMRLLDSLLMAVAEETKVPAGQALAVDRQKFAAAITRAITTHPLITVIREEIKELPADGITILATGPLTATDLAADLARHTGAEHLAFYDAIAPIVTADSLDRTVIYQASRYDDGPGDYLNCPFTPAEYQRFIEALAAADKVPLKSFEAQKYFEGCLPIEVMLERGVDTLRFGPMKPVGLPDPRTGRDPYAVVQLRLENKEGSHYNMVGFQTKLSYPAQKEVFRLIPGMEEAEFVRLGSIHRNTFVSAPEVLLPSLQLKKHPHILLAGQISGVEGYVESTAMGLVAGRNAARLLQGLAPLLPPPDTAHGALIRHLTEPPAKHFQPSNVNYSLFPPFDKEAFRASQPQQPPLSQKGRRRSRISKRDKAAFRSHLALQSLRRWLASL
ncbi:MAG: methylenetetrahydrofolate--tRNA-(uracil(54)-C(5))-methyltransferase (FADH(2)-oxidizing) TrmFO [Desulfurivibrionaceae bacterium]|nr:methylenetetrahydrofolate--tRNA-(uracil(54)-C(5))-methyltransferase (FADH(2)-oxidizing) TrmFO [Desulfurivibrionaceae bacterium]